MDQATESKLRKHIAPVMFYAEYRFFTVVLLLITVYAFVLDSPIEIFTGLYKIITSRSLLITDYMLVGGTGAMLLNGALVGAFALGFVTLNAVKPNGATIMALWMTVGFGFFGKNILNMLPLTGGVWLYSKLKKEPFRNYSLAALLVGTLSPVVSELAFGFDLPHPSAGIALGILLGLLVGFVFPIVSSFTVRVHDGYNLYNMGFAGGLLAMFLVALLKAFGIYIETAALWGVGRDFEMSTLLYLLSLTLIVGGFIMGRGRDHTKALKDLMRSSGHLASDYYTIYGESSYINMGILGILTTTMTLLLGISINGPTMGGILTIIAFGCFGNHPRNVFPIMVGAMISTYANVLDFAAPGNALAVLFSAGLAPIAGEFGIIWGIVAGFMHATLVHHTGYMSNGLNLYNNGFAAGFVALLLVPIITALKGLRKKQENPD